MLKTFNDAQKESKGDIGKQNKATTSLYTWAKIVATIGAAGLVIFSAVGDIYNVPKIVERHTAKIEEHTIQLQKIETKDSDQDRSIAIHDKSLTDHTVNIDQLKSETTVNRNIIDNLRSGISDVNRKQDIIQNQYELINKSLIEVSTSMKFFKESMDKIEQKMEDRQ